MHQNNTQSTTNGWHSQEAYSNVTGLVQSNLAETVRSSLKTASKVTPINNVQNFTEDTRWIPSPYECMDENYSPEDNGFGVGANRDEAYLYYQSLEQNYDNSYGFTRGDLFRGVYRNFQMVMNRDNGILSHYTNLGQYAACRIQFCF